MKKQKTSYEEAKKKVAKIKRFYAHLTLFLIANSIVLFLKRNMIAAFADKGGITDQDVINWVDWNIISTPLIWGVVLLIHWISVFDLLFLKNWEKRQIQKHMETE